MSDGRPAAAAVALRVRLWADDPLDPPARSALASVTLVADAAANQAPASIELINRLAARGWLPVMSGIQGDPGQPEVLYHASIIYSMVGHEAGAVELLREAIPLAPDHAMALNNLGYTRLELGYQDPQTAAWIERAYELSPDDSNVLDTVGWLRYKLGQFDDVEHSPGAASLIERALDNAPDPEPEVLDHLGDARWRRAVELLEDPDRRERMLQAYGLIQTRRWGLLIIDPSEMYERQLGVVLVRAREKLRELELGRDPGVASIFEETGSPGGPRDGRP